MMNKKLTIVSVPIVTYNSSKTIIETLDSVYNQTYPTIELIVSDDCSTDDTVKVCRAWIEQNKNRFVRTEILTVEKNTGVSANCNRAEAACRGEWVKGIAGDDKLLPNCIEEFVNFVSVNQEATYVFCRLEGFGRCQEELDEYMNRCFDYSFFSLTPEEQYHRLVFKGNCLPAPAMFYNRKRAQEDAFGNDERIPMVEDYPKWMRMTKAGVKFYFIDKQLVSYRLSDTSISTTTTPSQRARQSSAMIYIYYQFKPRFHYYNSPIKKLGEMRKYIHAANTAWGGWFWKTIKGIDYVFAKTLNLFGAKLKL